MSYILDALKKLENEKTIKSRGSGMLSISGELFKEERHRPSGGNIWKIVVVVLAASLVTFGATWFFLKADKAQHVAKPHVTTQVPIAKQVSPRVPPEGSSSQVASTVQPQMPLPVLPDPAPVRQAVRPVVPVVKTTVSTTDDEESERKKISPKQLTLTKQKSVVTTIPPPADIKVSGIAWQDERNARRAVVNGFLMKEGSIVSGAKVAEIFQDRVRFSLDGRIFEVYLPASGFTGTTK